jgi:predicted secreted acid phosphatase
MLVDKKLAEGISVKPLAIVVDCDEAIIDNSAYMDAGGRSQSNTGFCRVFKLCL